MMQKWLKQIRLSLSKFISRFTDTPIPIGMGNTVESPSQDMGIVQLPVRYMASCSIFTYLSTEVDSKGRVIHTLSPESGVGVIYVDDFSFKHIFKKV